MLVILRVHILAESPVILFPLPAWDWILWTSTVCETEIGYRMKAYTILYIFASFLVIFTNMLHIFMYILWQIQVNVFTNLYIVVYTLTLSVEARASRCLYGVDLVCENRN